METSNPGISLVLVEEVVGFFSLIFPRAKKDINARRVRYVICFYANPTSSFGLLKM